MIPLLYKIFPLLSFFFPQPSNELFTMFLPPNSRFNPMIYPSTDKPYPPAILVKHHTWFLQDVDLFISCDHILYGVHQSQFNQSPLFQEIIQYGRTNKIGINPYHPILFDTLIKEILIIFFIFYTLEPNTWNTLPQKTGYISNISALIGTFLEFLLPSFEHSSRFEEDLFLHLSK
jgi:hypothetical protein